VAALRDAVSPGSCLVLCHPTTAGRPGTVRAMETVDNASAATSGHIRPRAEIERFFDGFELLSPGLVRVPEWRPDPGADDRGDRGALRSLIAGVRPQAIHIQPARYRVTERMPRRLTDVGLGFRFLRRPRSTPRSSSRRCREVACPS
jgi:hypothetical protein